MNFEQKAFLDTLAWSEIGPQMLSLTDNGYNVCVGSTPKHLILFHDYSTHPRIRNEQLNSDAAGRYQFLGRYWEHYRIQLGLPDFAPAAQDRWAIQLIAECGAIDEIARGDIPEALRLCRSRWASLPGAGYGQHENKMADLIDVYHKALNGYLS